MEFTSQVSTTIEQGERLLALGIERETADLYYSINPRLIFIRDNGKHGVPLEEEDIPSWSLHRLIEMMPQEIFYEDSTLILGVFGDGVYYADNEYGEVFRSFDGNLYECIIKCIDWLIKEGFFNKDYLGEE